MIMDRFVKTMLVIIAGLLLLNLFGARLASLVAPEVVAEATQPLTFRGNGVGIAASDDGRYVYAVSSSAIFRSVDYGRPGSWEEVARRK